MKNQCSVKVFSTVADFDQLFFTESELLVNADSESKFAPLRNYATLLSQTGSMWKLFLYKFTKILATSSPS